MAGLNGECIPMFRIREFFPDKTTVYLWFDGRLSEEDLETAQSVISTYLKEDKKVIVNISNLTHVGWQGKKFFRQIKDTVCLEGEAEHLRTGLGLG